MCVNTGKAAFIFNQLTDLLRELDDLQYRAPLPLFSGASVGKHVRHIIEFFNCVRQAESADSISYDDRSRDQILETERLEAHHALVQLKEVFMSLNDRPVTLRGSLNPVENGDEWHMQSSLLREFYYAVEHAIHHMAIIKIGLQAAFPEVRVPDDFGIAPSTLRHEQQLQAQ